MTTQRIRSIDIVRGVVMVLMALDHVRVFSGIPAGGPTPALFLTRWVTNFCAPAFFFLAGTGAYLYAQKVNDLGRVARWLAVRGAWLVVLELTVLRFAWTFNFAYDQYLLAGVIWSLGLSMIVLAGLIRLPIRAIAAIGIGIVVLQQLLVGLLMRANPALADGGSPWYLTLLYFGGPIQLGGADGPTFFVLYSLFSWAALMAAGYAFGRVMLLEPVRRRRVLLSLGAGCVAAFLVLRGLDLYGDPRHWRGEGQGAAWMRFLNTSKYPASLLFSLMTLGPMFLVMPALERARGKVTDVLALFGRVPLFFYLLHIPLIHATAMVVSLIRRDGGIGWLLGNHPTMIGPAPEGYRWSLPLLYAITALCVALLYLPCRWFAAQRARQPDSWLRYL
ncbi:MAG TPA: heparan-alpha-glucosaminide N-acetyltransferase domain-containing protein [Gemmatimonadaceae bacterium]|nr:heparan-alpha-glucosaminide N-acetyltransferase domain-containing protein [Gemmatimonadaceae bacterium]